MIDPSTTESLDLAIALQGAKYHLGVADRMLREIPDELTDDLAVLAQLHDCLATGETAVGRMRLIVAAVRRKHSVDAR